MADNIRATPRNEFLGLLADAMYGGLEYMKDPRRTQQMQGLAGLLESTGIPKTTERMAYGEDLTNIGRANVPLLKPETADAMMNVAPLAPAVGRLASRAIRATEGMPVGMSIKPINLNKGIYKSELTMEEMLKVKDIPTVDRVRQSIDLVGKKEFERMVNAQYSKYKPSDVDQEAMLVESVTLDILGKAQRSPYPQQAALDLAQQRAALPKSESGLGLPANNTPEMRYQAMKGVEGNFVHGSKNPNIEKFKTRKQIFEESANDPNRAIAENHYANERNAVFASSDPEFTTAFSQHGYTDIGQAPTSYPLRMIGGNKVFDFKNPSHLDLLKQKYAEMFPVKTIGREGYVPSEESIRMHTINKRIENLPNDTNNWPAIESQDFQKAIRELGFDAFHVNERGTKNIGVYDPSSLRSPFAAYDPFRKDVATATAMGVALPDLLAAELPEEELKRNQSAGLLFP